MNKVIGYIRVSIQEQAREGHSLEAQRRKIKMYCELHDLDLIDIVADEGISGKSIEGRAGLLDIIERSKTDEFNGIVVFKMDRLTRCTRDLHQLLDTVFKANKLHAVQDQINSDTATGKMMMSIMMSISEWECGIIAERTSEALQCKKAVANEAEAKRAEKTNETPKNISINGRPPFGYQWDNGTLVKHPTEYPILSAMKELRDAGYTYAQVADQLTADGILTKRGKKWNTGTIYKILKRTA